MSILDEICETTGLPTSWLLVLEKKAPFAYKRYRIPKKNGDFRIIYQPSREVKAIQYWLIENIFKNLPTHPAATAYKSGASIKSNAEPHKDSKYIAKFDFKNFFPSISEKNITIHIFNEIPNLTEREIIFIGRFCCRKDKHDQIGHLSIGAPSSPILSNSIMFKFDEFLFDESKKIGVTYTRYADDITLSSKSFLDPKTINPLVLKAIKSVEKTVTVGLNHKKTIYLSKANCRRVTGVVLTNDGSISLGREKKRIISAMLHQYRLGTFPDEKIPYLRGLLAHANAIEPDFIARLEKKYELLSALSITNI